MEKSLELIRQLINDFREHEKGYIDNAVYELGVYYAEGGRLTEKEKRIVDRAFAQSEKENENYTTP
jgi:hypothetical protein